MSREYLIKGLEDEDVKHYFNFMQKVLRPQFPPRGLNSVKPNEC
jgi:hypothetical protein